MLAGPSQQPPSTNTLDTLTVKPNDVVMLRLSNGGHKTCVAKPNSVIALGKMGSFPASAIIGKPFGFTYEIVPPASTSNKGKDTCTLVVKDDLPVTNIDQSETEATNENIGLAAGAQRLTMEDIQKLVDSGADGRSIIAKQIAEHSAFEMKNSHSKQKYIARKESKYIKYFTLLTPSPYNICDVEFQSRGLNPNLPSKIRELRPDSLSQLLSLGNARPGGRTLCIEDASGIVIGSVLSRMGGQGQLLHIHDADSPPSNPVLPSFNLSKNEMRPYEWIHWAMAEKDYTAPGADHTDAPTPPADVSEAEAKKVEKEKKKNRKRHDQRKDVGRRRALLHDGQWDSLLISSTFELCSMIDYLKPYLAGSASVVVHSPTLQPLMHLQQHLLTQDGFVNVQVIEPILRRYQVFPGRTHPYMNGTAGGGFLLSATHVFSNDQTVSANLRVKRKAEDKPSEENKRAKPDMTEIAQDNTGADAEGNTVEK